MADQQTELDVVDELTMDHREALALLGQIESSNDHQERRDLTDVVISEVVRHAVAEEMYVYPTIRDHLPNGKKVVEHDKKEHKQLEEIMKRLEGLRPDEAGFGSLVRELTETLRHHAHDEETEQFPQLRKHVERDQLVELRERIDMAKKLAPTRPHPGAPRSELFHKIVGPGVGMVDRLRDALSYRPNL
jgi:hemerythrin superfamily protein